MHAPASTPYWACIALPQLALDCVLRHHPKADQPLALIGGHPQRRELLAVNHAAAQLGLRAGQRLVLAQAIAPQCITVAHDPAEGERWQTLLAAWAYRYSGQVSTQWPQALVLEVGSSLTLMKGWPHLQAQLRQDLQALQFQHRIALAPNPRAAWVLAQLRDGLAFWQERDLLHTLDAVPVRRAALPGDAGQRLHAMGVRRLQALWAMPRDGLCRRFGPELLDHLDRLRGHAPEPLVCYQPPDRFDVRIELAFNVDTHQPLLFPIRRMLADLAAFLQGRAGGVQRFMLRLEHDDRSATTIDIGMLAAERDAHLLFEITRTRLEAVALPAPVIALRLVARDLPPFEPSSRDLFDERPVGAVPWEQLRERLRARLGEHAIYHVQEASDPRPERAWQRSEAGGAAAPRHPEQQPCGPARPTWLLPEPVPLQQAPLRILKGPERLESGWWDGGDAKRDYYVLETAPGQRAWAFVPVGHSGPWMLHGWFA